MFLQHCSFHWWPNLSCHVVSVSLWLSSICVQVLRAVTSSSTTCHRSSPTLRYCRCSCLSEMSSLQRSLLTVPPTRVNASVSHFADNVCDGCCHLVVFRGFLSYVRKDIFFTIHVILNIFTFPLMMLLLVNVCVWFFHCHFLLRFCEFWQPIQRPDCHPGHERLPDRHEETEGAAEEAQGCQQALLKEVSYSILTYLRR